MFCYQCEQAAKDVGCSVSGICGKSPAVADGQDALTAGLISLAAAVQDKASPEAVDLIAEGLFLTMTNVNFDENRTAEMLKQVKALGASAHIAPESLFRGDPEIVSLRSTLLFGLRGMGAYAYHARILGRRDETVDRRLVSGLASLAADRSADEWLSLILETGGANLKCMALLDEANTEAYGVPRPVTVPLTLEKGPFIVVTGHDLHDMYMLLEQTDGAGVNVYTHCEMLSAHAYPELKKHPQLKGHFGTAWQNQRKEFDAIPGAALVTTNCLMPPKPSYADRIYTTAVTGFPGVKHISADKTGRKDFSALIGQAKRLGGYQKDTLIPGLNGGATVTTGYGRETLLSNAGAIVEAVKAGKITHFFLVGGCDGAKPGRNYYTEFVKQTPADTVTLTLACGKFRFNDLDLGAIGPFPRILDMGQCNDAYGAIEIALALAKAFECSVNELPLTLVLSWFEQKAVIILLTLLSLGIEDIYIGPSLPAFLSDTVLKTLVEKFKLRLITAPEQDLKTILKK